MHVFARGNRRQDIFLDDRDRDLYLSLLGQVVARQRWRCLAYCLMGNHVHLLIETPEPNLAAGMQRLHSLYAQTYNKRHGSCGHVFQGRFGANRVKTDEQLLMAARYIAMNPVEAGLCDDPGDWVWSSHAAVLGGAAAPEWLDVARLRAYLAAWGGDGRDRYDALVR
jgi:putative transposase